MSEWSGSHYEGETLDGWYHGKGKFTYPNGVIYEGEFFKGEFHGQGILEYPNGKGKYKAIWENGKMISGDYYFHDDLKYEFENWNYCTDKNRMFYQEHLKGILPAGATQQTHQQQGAQKIPEGTYDIGEGYFEPIRSLIYKYDCQISRTPDQFEVEMIIKKCRYNPRVELGEVSGKDDIVVQRVQQWNRLEQKQ